MTVLSRNYAAASSVHGVHRRRDADSHKSATCRTHCYDVDKLFEVKELVQEVNYLADIA